MPELEPKTDSTTWTQLRLVVNADQVKTLSSIMEMFLAQAVTFENAGADEFYEVAFPGTPDWQKVTVTGLFSSLININPIIEFIQTQLCTENTSEIPTVVNTLVDQDWQRVWLNSFEPIKVGNNLWVCPSWCEPVEASQRNIILDPGLAFGTGTHATTAMCLNWLADQDLSQQNVLDYGSGSGILAIAALFSGADHAVAVDIDPLAISACNENARRNKLQHKLRACLPHTLPSGTYKLIIANILVDVIVNIKGTLLSHLASGGVLLLTGILNKQADQVINAYGKQFNFEKHTRDQWCLLIGSKS